MNLRPLLIGAIATCILALTAGLGLVYTLHRVVADLPALPADPAELGLRPGTDIYAASGQRIYTFNQSPQWGRRYQSARRSGADRHRGG